MPRIRTILTLPLLAATAIASRGGETSIDSMSISALEERLDKIDEELSGLANYSLRAGLGSKGYRSNGHADPRHTEWIEIDLGDDYAVNQIALVPSILRETKQGFIAESFPSEFRVIAGTGDIRGGIEVARFKAEDQLLPRIAPLVIDVPDVVADWVRIEATTLTPRGFEGRYFLQLAEILVFSGFENVALRKPVKIREQPTDTTSAWNKDFAVDGFVPYLMDAAQGEKSLSFVGLPEEQPYFLIDLGKPYALTQINLHTVEQSTTVPLSTPGDFGLPKRLIVEGANQEDFSDAATLIDYRRNNIKDIGPITTLPLAETSCRYVRLTAEPQREISPENAAPQKVGFAEIELISEGRNVALDKSVSTNLKPAESPLRSKDTLTDGLNYYGQILATRTWIEQLARRHDLEVERPLIVSALDIRYARQKANLNRTYWLVALLAGTIVAIILIDRIVRLRQIASIKERLAADLHDELGADLHTIGLLSDLAEESKNSPEELAMLHKRIRKLTMQSGSAVRHCTDMLEAAGSNVSIRDNIYQASRRIMAKLENSISIEGEEYLDNLKSKTRFDLCLFYNECLVNISRHSGASKFVTQLIADKNSVLLAVSDNGRGLSNTQSKDVPKSLKRRARLLGAKVSVEQPASGGTRINLKLKTRKWGFRK